MNLLIVALSFLIHLINRSSNSYLPIYCHCISFSFTIIRVSKEVQKCRFINQYDIKIINIEYFGHN